MEHFTYVIKHMAAGDEVPDSDNLEICIKEMIRTGSDISLDLREYSNVDKIHAYDLKKKRIVFETGVQYLIACHKLDPEVTEIVLSKINSAGVDNCSTFMKDACIDLRLYSINNQYSDVKAIISELLQFVNECQLSFEETHSMRDLFNILKIYISIHDVEIEIQDAEGLQEWRRNVKPLLIPLGH